MARILTSPNRGEPMATDNISASNNSLNVGILGLGLLGNSASYSINLNIDYGTNPPTVLGGSTMSITALGLGALPIALTNISVVDNGNGTYTASGTDANVATLSLTYSGQAPGSITSASLTGLGSNLGVVLATGNPNAAVVSAPLCFASGTFIATDRGDVAVEDLSLSDRVLTVDGSFRPIIWIGSRKYKCGDRVELAPVRIKEGAFGYLTPKRDLFLSPGHPVLVKTAAQEVLVPIMCLINGITIDRTTAEEITYWHVELDKHDILFADGLPVESYFEWGTRSWFEGNIDSVILNPDYVTAGLLNRCRPVAIDGPLVEGERRRIDVQFSASLDAQANWPMENSLDLPLHFLIE
jgi:Hint domain